MGLAKKLLKAVFSPPKMVRVGRFESGVADVRDHRGRPLAVDADWDDDVDDDH